MWQVYQKLYRKGTEEMTYKKKKQKREELVIRSLDIMQKINKLKLDHNNPYMLKVIVLKELNKELYQIKKEMERLENGKRKAV